MALVHRPLNFKLMLEGVTTPFSDISVTDGVNITSTATITIPYHMNGKFIRPRTSVIVFFRYEDVGDMPYNLFFFGEVLGISIIKQKNGRAIQLQCASLSNFLDNNYIQFTSYVELGDATNLGDHSAGSIVVKPNFASSDQFAQFAKESMSSYIHQVLNMLWSSDMVPDVFLSKFAAYRMFDRFITLPLDLTDNFTKALNTVGNLPLKERLVSTLQRFTRYSEHMASVKSLMLMDYVENRAAARQNFMFKPILYYGIPPRCNVVFPCHYESFTFHEDFANSPTRLLYSIASPFSDGVDAGPNAPKSPVKVMGLSPYELKKSFAKGGPGASYSLFYTAEETERGVVPYIGSDQDLDTIWFTAMRGHTEGGKNNPQYEETLQQWQDFKLFYLKSKFKRLDLAECVFLPYLMCGFPISVLDPQGFYAGYLESVTHTISAQGKAASRMNITSVREMIDPVLGRPWWLKDLAGGASSYSLEKIDQEIYQKYLGCNSIIETEEAIAQAEESASELRKPLFDEKMIGALHPTDVVKNWEDLCATPAVPSTVYTDTKKLQTRMFHSLLKVYLDYERDQNKYLFAENYNFRPASSLKSLVGLHKEYIEVDERDQEAFDAGEFVDRLNPKVITSDLGFPKTRPIPVVFFRKINQEIIDLYRTSLSKINVDSELYGVTYPGALAANALNEIKALTTAPDRFVMQSDSELFVRKVTSNNLIGGKYDHLYNTSASDTAKGYGETLSSPESYSARGEIMAEEGKTVAPMKPGSYRLTSGYQEQRSGYKHGGVDLAAKEGTPVYAVRDGTVRLKTQSQGIDYGHGRYVEVEHDDGTSTIYSHLSGYNGNLKSGMRVGAGTLLGGTGHTGRTSRKVVDGKVIRSGDHLHFEYKTTGPNGAKRNPNIFLGKP